MLLMSQLTFNKYQATGNDFIMVDDRSLEFDLDDLKLVQALCNRRFGIGADGLIIIRPHTHYDFEMIYYNADGSQSLCGNGSRCAVHFANQMGMLNNSTDTEFLAIDGAHHATIYNDGNIGIAMHDVSVVENYGNDLFINTGSPHYIRFVDNHEKVNVVHEGRALRYAEPFGQPGTNVNFIEAVNEHTIFVRTYERGVEGETLSCGTGVTAASLAASVKGFASPVQVQTLGGALMVKFKKVAKHQFENIELIGPAKQVFKGTVDTKQLTDNIAGSVALV